MKKHHLFLFIFMLLCSFQINQARTVIYKNSTDRGRWFRLQKGTVNPTYTDMWLDPNHTWSESSGENLLVSAGGYKQDWVLFGIPDGTIKFTVKCTLGAKYENFLGESDIDAIGSVYQDGDPITSSTNKSTSTKKTSK